MAHGALHLRHRLAAHPGAQNVEADPLSGAPFIRPTVNARQNRAALMYETAASTVSADGNPTVHFLTVEEVEPANNFYQATTRVVCGEAPCNWDTNNRHARHLPVVHWLATYTTTA